MDVVMEREFLDHLNLWIKPNHAMLIPYQITYISFFSEVSKIKIFSINGYE